MTAPSDGAILFYNQIARAYGKTVYDIIITRHRKDAIMAKIIAFVNHKGGVAKTTTCTNMGACLVRKGYRTLVIDGDPQCNLTDTYRAEVHDVATLYDVLIQDEPAANAIQHTAGGDILAGDPLLENAEQLMNRIGRENVLRVALQPLAERYEYILIDTPPLTGILRNNALVAADSVIVPLTAERYAFSGLSDLAAAVANVRAYTPNQTLTIEGIVLVKVLPRRKLTRETAELLPGVCEQLGTRCYQTTIREAEAVRLAQAARQDIYTYAASCGGRCPVAEDYTALTEEFLMNQGQ